MAATLPPSPPSPLSRAFPLPSAPNGRGGTSFSGGGAPLPLGVGDGGTRGRGAGGEGLSFAQERLWFFDRFEPGRATYNIPAGVRLEGDLDAGALAAALSAVVARHAVLRTVFPVSNGQPYQKVMPPEPVPLPVVDLTAVPAEEEALRLAREEARRPFDL